MAPQVEQQYHHHRGGDEHLLIIRPANLTSSPSSFSLLTSKMHEYDPRSVIVDEGNLCASDCRGGRDCCKGEDDQYYSDGLSEYSSVCGDDYGFYDNEDDDADDGFFDRTVHERIDCLAYDEDHGDDDELHLDLYYSAPKSNNKEKGTRSVPTREGARVTFLCRARKSSASSSLSSSSGSLASSAGSFGPSGSSSSGSRGNNAEIEVAIDPVTSVLYRPSTQPWEVDDYYYTVDDVARFRREYRAELEAERDGEERQEVRPQQDDAYAEECIVPRDESNPEGYGTTAAAEARTTTSVGSSLAALFGFGGTPSSSASSSTRLAEVVESRREEERDDNAMLVDTLYLF